MRLTWHTDDPDFTTCFQRTALIWGPCAFLWIFSLFDLYYIQSSINRNIPWGFLNTTKTVFTTALIFLTCADLLIVVANQKDNNVYPVDFYTPVIKIATFVSETNYNMSHIITPIPMISDTISSTVAI